MKTLPRNIYEQLKAAAEKFGGVGSGTLKDRHGPCCLLGLAGHVDGLDMPIGSFAPALREYQLYRVAYDGEAPTTPALTSVRAAGDWRDFDNAFQYARDQHALYSPALDRVTDFDAFLKAADIEVAA